MSSHASRLRARLFNPPNARPDTEIDLGRQSNAARAALRELETRKRVENKEFEQRNVVVEHPKAPDERLIPIEVSNKVRRIQNAVAEAYRVGWIELVSHRRNRLIARPRQVAMYLCCTILTEKSTQEIGRQFSRDHTTVLHARNKVALLRRVNAELDAKINEIIGKLGTAG